MSKTTVRAGSARPVQDIIRLLERVESSGQRSHQIFEDWLALVEAALDMLPAHVESLARTGQMAEDTPEVTALWEQMRRRYNPERRTTFSLNGTKRKDVGYFDIFAEAFTILVDAARPLQSGSFSGIEGPDIVGSIYMTYAYPSPAHGQYFTPWPVASMMARILVTDGEAEVQARLKEAAQTCEDLLVEALVITSLVVPEDHAQEWFHTKLLPALAPHVKPITVQDPCIGSGILMLAVAGQYPQWAINWGLVQFYGQDIDPVCVQMARINFKLYGLDPLGLRAAAALSEMEIENLIPAGAQPAYLEAKEASNNGDQQRVKEIADKLRQDISEYQQANLFDF